MFTVTKETNNHPWANLQAKAEGFMTVYAKFDEGAKTLEIMWPPEGDSEVYENIPSMSAALKKLGSVVCQTSTFVFKQNY